jgi:hypothetical protein
MPKSGKNIHGGRTRGYLHAAGPQLRFILFLILLLITYTILLRVFQKLAEIVQLPVFLPISLIALLFFIGIGGMLYSHTFVGPMARIRRALEHLAEGDANMSLRLRDSDDPMLKDMVRTIGRVCEHSRETHTLIGETAKDLFDALAELRLKIDQGADRAVVQEQLDAVRRKQEILDRAIRSFRKV